MDRKNRVWLITLIVLLVASIVGLVLVKNQWDASESSYVRANAQLTEEQSSSEKLRAELDELKAEIETLKAELAAANAELEAHQLATIAPTEAVPTEAPTAIAPTDTATAAVPTAAPTGKPSPAVGELQDALKTAGEKAEALNAEIAASQPDNTDASAALAELKTALETAETKMAELPAGDPVGELKTALHTATEKATALEDSLKDAIAAGGTEIETGVAELKTALETAETKATALNSDELNAMSAQFADAQNRSTDLEAQLKAAQDEAASLTAALEQAQAQTAELESKLADSQAESENLSTQLADSKAESESLSAQLADSKAESENLSAQLTDSKAESENLSAQLADAQTELESLRDQLAQTQDELNSTRETLSQRIAALEAYLLERELSEGEAHSSTTAATTIHIAADGKTGTWDYTNNTVSGNSVVLTLAMGQTELFRSESLAPGAALNEIQLNTTLAPGAYEGVATTAIYAEDGTYLFANRIPVTIEVAAE